MHFASHYRWLVYQDLFGVPAHIATLLDIGCDDGGFVEQLPAQTSVAIDLDIRSLRRAQVDQKVCADGTRLPFRDATFDLVLLSDVIEHVEDDLALVAAATEHVRPGGALWLSTTAAHFVLFPDRITARAERSWGHVRKGYTSEQLCQLVGDDFDCQLVVWPEVVFRHLYLAIWLCSKRLPGLARILASLCFLIDRKVRNIQQSHGHLYLRAVRRSDAG
jgi:SAM-dependent methyltransferase